MHAKTWRLWLSYLGTNFAGFQRQSHQPTVQAAIESAFVQLTGLNPEIIPAGRTDAGVHARGQVISCSFESRFDSRTLPLALSHFLGPDICVYRADEMFESFNAKRHSIGKRYVYRIQGAAQHTPFDRLYAWHLKNTLDIKAMQEAANHLVGEHDFESFRSTHCVADHARRYLWKIEVTPETIEIRGNAFCHNMVRIIVGNLVEVGLGKRHAHDMKSILEAKDRTLAGRTAPAHGLSLEEVYYPDDLRNAQIPSGAVFPRYPVRKETWPC